MEKEDLKDYLKYLEFNKNYSDNTILSYREDITISDIVNSKKKETPLYDVTTEDGVIHRVWIINEKESVDTIYNEFSKINDIYIADGHHRCASAVKVGLKRREANPSYTGDEEFNFVMSVLFPEPEVPSNKTLSFLSSSTRLNSSDCFFCFFLVLDSFFFSAMSHLFAVK
jgi:uncharacterized protein (DUF1015 family)